MPFQPGSNKKMNFLHALAGDKAKGIQPISGQMAAPMAGAIIPTAPMPLAANPAPPRPVPMVHIPQAPAPRLIPPNLMGNPNVPALGGMAKLPKFAKTRNSLKSGPFKKQ